MTVNCNRHMAGDAEAAQRLLPADWPHRKASRLLAIDGLSWHLQFHPAKTSGGPLLLLLHGTGSSAHSWSELIDPLTGFADVLAVDLPGHGFTRGAQAHMMRLPAMAEELQQLLVCLQCAGRLVIVGHSAGAPLAIEWALRFAKKTPALTPIRIVGLNPSLVPPPLLYTTLLGPMVAPIATSSPMTGMLAFLAANTGMVDQLLDSTGSKIPESHRRLYRYLFTQPNHVQGAMEFMAGADLPGLLSRSLALSLPTRFLLGAQDAWVKEVPLKNVIRSSFPKAEVTTWTGGHLLHEERPAEVAQFIQTMVLTA